jgi:hypothetical protein
MANIPLAKKTIQEANQLCLSAAQLADQYAAYDTLRSGEVARKQTELTAGHALVQGRATALGNLLRQAENQAKSLALIDATATLRKALAHIKQTKAECADHDRQQLALETVEGDLAALTKVRPRSDAPVIGADLATLDGLLAKAWGAHLKRDFKAADAAMEEIKARTKAVKLKSNIAKGGGDANAMKTEFKELCELPGGTKLLDEIVASSSQKGAKGDNRKLVLAALEARFNLQQVTAELNKGGGGTVATLPELVNIYKLMAAIPDKHTRDNPRFKSIARNDSGQSSYNEYDGAMVLGDAFSKSPANLAVASTDGPIDPGCEAAPVAAPTHFDWNVQHEVGHTLDDKKTFMMSHLGDPAFGGWADHGGDLQTVAAAVAGAFAVPQITAQVIATYLDDGTEPAPHPPRWAEVTQWAGWVRSTAMPWDYDAECNKEVTAAGLAVNGRVYQEAYPNHWCSYLASTRKQRVSTYQFRWTGEWFSELYAAYKSGAMNANHPARGWLDKLFGKGKVR